MIVLGIETSCDETAAAVVADGRRILSNVVASQVDLHARYGGIVPEVASRQHLLAILPVLDQALRDSGLEGPEVDAIAVTAGPGLAGSLLVGVNLAKALALARDKPLIAVNHLEAHIYANWLEDEPPPFPLVCLIVSGGHTELVLMSDHGQYRPLGATRDDAAGEAFDKAARVLGLGYPGGPAIEQASRQAHHPYPFPRAWLRGSPDFSFSGLKTAVLHGAAQEGLLAEGLQDLESLAPRKPRRRGGATAADLAAGFQEAVVAVLVKKTIQAAQRHQARLVLLAGGVAANNRLRDALSAASPIPVRCPRPALCTDNAAMTAACGYYRLREGKAPQDNVDVRPTWRLV